MATDFVCINFYRFEYVYETRTDIAVVTHGIPFVPPATVSLTYKQGQVRDATITHLPLFCCHRKALRHAVHTPFRRQRSQKA